MNRLASIVLTLALTIPLVPAAAQELPPGSTFIDDDDGSVHEPAIEALVAAGITQGCETDRYCPEDPVTRGQMASFLARAVPDLDPATRDWFPDDNGNVHEPDINMTTGHQPRRHPVDVVRRDDPLPARNEPARRNHHLRHLGQRRLTDRVREYPTTLSAG